MCHPILQVLAICHYSNIIADEAVLFWFVHCDRRPVPLDVGLYPKMGEEEEEEGTVDPDEVDPQGNLVITLFHEVVLADVNRDQNKLGLYREKENRFL